MKSELRKTQLDKITIDSKLSKIVTMKQLDANFLMIERNSFFDNRKTKVSQLQNNLSNSVQEQYQSSQSIAYAAKYARIWLQKVRERKRNRQMQEEQNINYDE